MTYPFDPHPKWRRNFEFTAAYTHKDTTYTLDPTVQAIKPIQEFTLDPIIHKYSWPVTQTGSMPS